jgi:hypothetical protein
MMTGRYTYVINFFCNLSVRQNKDKDSKSDGAEPKIINEVCIKHDFV